MMEDKILVKCFEVNNKDYYVVNETNYNEKHYVYLINKNDDEDIMIRILKDNKLIPLSDQKELEEVLKLIVK